MPENRRKYRNFDAKFKLRVILDMRNNKLSYYDTSKKYLDVATKRSRASNIHRIKLWERIFLEEGETGLMTEKRGRASGEGQGRPLKKTLTSEREKDLIAENQYLRAENEYLKKLNALVLAEEQAINKKHK